MDQANGKGTEAAGNQVVIDPSDVEKKAVRSLLQVQNSISLLSDIIGTLRAEMLKSQEVIANLQKKATPEKK